MLILYGKTVDFLYTLCSPIDTLSLYLPTSLEDYL